MGHPPEKWNVTPKHKHTPHLISPKTPSSSFLRPSKRRLYILTSKLNYLGCAAPPLPMDEDRSLKVVIRNIPPLIRDQRMLEEFLMEKGGLASTHRRLILSGPGTKKGYAFVTFATSEERVRAVAALNGLEVEGGALIVELSEKPDPTRNVYISHLPTWCTPCEVLGVAALHGTIATFTSLAPIPKFEGKWVMMVQMGTQEEAQRLVKHVHGVALKAGEEGREYVAQAELQSEKLRKRAAQRGEGGSGGGGGGGSGSGSSSANSSDLGE